MKNSVRVVLVISFALLILASPSSDENSKKDSKDGFEFKNTRWGMTVDEVKSSEANTPYEEENNLILYKEQFEDIPSTLGYIFEDGRLVKPDICFMRGMRIRMIIFRIMKE